MKSIIFSHKGQRSVNQDYVLVQNLNDGMYLSLVADGMGGYDYGEVAARLVAESILAYLSTVKHIDYAQLQKAVNKANLSVRQLREKNNSQIGATVGGIIIQSDVAICFWVGDVKIFHFRNNKLTGESVSHTLVNEVISNGSISDPKQIDKYRHVVTRSVQGEVKHSEIETFTTEKIDDKDLFIICSDGVHDLYNGFYLQQVLNTFDTIKEAMQYLEKCLLKDAKDNFSLISVIV